MKIVEATTWRRKIPLVDSYAIAGASFDSCELLFIRLRAEDGTEGLGSASPGERVTGEEMQHTVAVLADLSWLVGSDLRHLGARLASTPELRRTPAARAAVDMALYDLFSRHLDIPLVDLLGPRREPLPTSVTLGIDGVEETLATAERWLAEGFTVFKVKVGDDFGLDERRLARLRELVRERGVDATIRIDANGAYTVEDAAELWHWVERFELEMIEQPFAARGRARDATDFCRLPPELRRRTAADESLLGLEDVVELSGREACGILNFKLMKCGGIREALQMAELAKTARLEVMWGCMDESRISIAAALHAALACPATRYLDLDGSFELSRDVAAGGFTVEPGGVLRLLDRPGLGVELLEEPG